MTNNTLNESATSDSPASMFIDQISRCAVAMDKWRVVAWQRVYELGDDFGISRQQADLHLLEAGFVSSRYLRNVPTIGLEGQKALLEASVFIAGCGGLGGRVAELLTRLGVGQLVLADGDIFADHNLNRQVACTEQSVGQNKCTALKTYLTAINSAVNIKTYPTAITSDNITQLLEGCSVAVTGLDSLSARKIVIQAANRLELPVVHGGIEDYCGQVACLHPHSVQAAVITSSCDQSVLPDKPPASHPDTIPQECSSNLQKCPSGDPLPSFGSPCFSVSLVASLQAAEVVRLVTGQKGLLDTHMLHADLRTMVFEVTNLDN